MASWAELHLLTRKARLAQGRRDWRAAANLWRRASERAPHNRSAAIGYISALIYSGEVEEAAARTQGFVAAWPNDENGQMALARIAEAKGNPDEAIRHWRAALELKPFQRQALIRLGALVLSAGQTEGALACAETLAAKYPAEPHGPILQAQIAQQRTGFADAAPLWRGAKQRFPADISVLRAYGRAALDAGEYDVALAIAENARRVNLYDALRLEGQVLAKREPYRDHTDFWKRASAQLADNVDITRKLLHAALWARRLDQAGAAFGRLLEQQQLHATDADYVIGLGNMHLDLGNKTAARATVRGFMKAMRGRFDYRAAGLRLDRMILSCFPRQPGAAVGLARSKDRFTTIIRRARVTPEAKHSLKQVAELESGLRNSGALCVFDTGIDLECCRLFVRTVLDRLQRAEPFSLIRLGDGEANALDYQPTFADRFDEDAAARERIWWGRTLDSEARSNLAGCVRTAIDGADCLGIPLTARFLRDIRLTSGPPLLATRTGRGLLSIVKMLERRLVTHGFGGTLLMSAHIHQDLERWDVYGDLLGGQKEIVLVSCHAGLSDVLRDRFGATVVKHVITPPGDAMLEMQARKLCDQEVPPQNLEHALRELDEWPRGRLVLVGAGYAGKVIIHEARERGGVALDLGSIFDHWMGQSTRSYQDLA